MLNLKTIAKDIEIKFIGNSDGDNFLNENGRGKCINVNRCDMTIEILVSDNDTRSKILESVCNNLHLSTKNKTGAKKIKKL